MHPMLNTAVKAARRAGNIINRASMDLDRLSVARKGPRDFVTDVDTAAESAIIEILQTAYPDHGILAEESGEIAGQRESEFQWIIDPIDGTTNFVHGFPDYAVSIALAERGVVTQAVVYDPTRNELFTATRGAGAFLNDRRIRVSRRTRIEQALIGASFRSADDAQMVRWSRIFSEMSVSCAGTRRIGSAVLDLAWTAAGRLDGCYGAGLKPWDMAAGGLLILEAGGLIGDFAGEQTWLETGNLVASAPRLFPGMLSLLEPMQVSVTPR
ncbi:inositol monophosphatase [Achromobacter sp. GG226]|uniref:inositol monophosphatase family protein n=1 Tax=Verticiella alkaliphila TaxID=2779529 RepID=UPI001C0B8A8D|nr:inositol monophosphatase family protein [Verticiella sp. GG226]MBU4611913.1 inositol monophosphatase [Verticiella sp. GG226]